LTISPPAVLLGAQEPTWMSQPPAVSSAGLEAIDLAASAGLHLDDAQQLVLHGALGERADGTWSAFEVGVVEPRQNGKGGILEARSLAGLYLFGERLQLWSAHEFKTASEAFLRVLALIEGTPDLLRRVKKVTRSHGDEGIELVTGQRLRFVARSRTSGKGFTGDLVILDEAFELPASAVGALLPTMATRPNPQLWLTSSAPERSSLVLKKLCRRGRAGTSARLAFYEWCARIDPEATPEERRALIAAALDDREAWAQANPALGTRISEEFIEGERDAMDDETFARERLGIWKDEEAERFVPEATWDLVNRPDVEPEGRIVFGVDVNPERSATAIAVAGDWRPPDDERTFPAAELIEHKPMVGWLVGRCVELNEKWPGSVFAVDGSKRSPVASFVPALKAAGLKVVEIAGDWPAACGEAYDGIVERGIRVRRHASLDAAVAGADRRWSGDAWTWDRRGDADICPLAAMTAALWVAAHPEASPDVGGDVDVDEFEAELARIEEDEARALAALGEDDDL
jgi:hypothetical protein